MAIEVKIGEIKPVVLNELIVVNGIEDILLGIKIEFHNISLDLRKSDEYIEIEFVSNGNIKPESMYFKDRTPISYKSNAPKTVKVNGVDTIVPTNFDKQDCRINIKHIGDSDISAINFIINNLS